MKFQLLSDIHLEFGPIELPEITDKRTLLLAGDITVAVSMKAMDRFVAFLEREAGKFENVFYIAGNHEHYHGNIDEIEAWLEPNAIDKFPNVHFLENTLVDLAPGVKLFAATMWTDMDNENPLTMVEIQMGMNDFHLIEKNVPDPEKVWVRKVFKPSDAVELNRTSTELLVKALAEFPDDKFLVMTHHAPCLQSSHPKWGKTSNPLNFGYCNTKLEAIVRQSPNIVYWVHGHTHESHDYMLGENCRVLCNPRGYVQYSENEKFDNNKTFEIQEKE